MPDGDPHVEGIMSEIFNGFIELGLAMNPSTVKELSETHESIMATHDPEHATPVISYYQEIVETAALADVKEDDSDKASDMQITAMVTFASEQFNRQSYEDSADSLWDAAEYARQMRKDELHDEIIALLDKIESIMPKE